MSDLWTTSTTGPENDSTDPEYLLASFQRTGESQEVPAATWVAAPPRQVVNKTAETTFLSI